MISIGKINHVWVAMHKTDFRKYHDGLLGECYRMGLNPYSGDVVLFIGRCRRRMKIIYSDGTGLWISYKVFSRDTLKTKFRFLEDPSCREISSAELAMFFEGAAYRIERRPKE